MDVLIVGGTGVISTAVVNEAVKQGINVTCINRGNNHGIAPNPNITTMHFDVRNSDIANANLKGKFYDVVVDFICFNAEHVKYSLDLFHDKCHQYVFISTDSVYKLQKDGHYDETIPQSNSEWNYSYQKSECEDIVRSYCKQHQLNYTIVRPSITYGNTRIPYGLMPANGYHYTIIDRIKAGKPIITWNKAENWQTVMRVEDFAIAMVGLWGKEEAYNNDFGICGEAVKWGDILDTIDAVIGCQSNRVETSVDTISMVFPERKGEFLIDRASDHIVSNLKLKRVLPSFKTTVSLHEGIKRTIDYYRMNNKVLGVDYKFDGQLDRISSMSMGGAN